MIRGACQQFKFKTPYPLSQLKTVRITFWQPNNDGTKDCSLPITKVITDCVEDANSQAINVTLNDETNDLLNELGYKSHTYQENKRTRYVL